jgi:hypothetical protein
MDISQIFSVPDRGRTGETRRSATSRLDINAVGEGRLSGVGQTPEY